MEKPRFGKMVLKYVLSPNWGRGLFILTPNLENMLEGGKPHTQIATFSTVLSARRRPPFGRKTH